jgi:hypothetical protein
MDPTGLDDVMTIFDVSQFVAPTDGKKESPSLPVPQIQNRPWKMTGSIPNIYHPFSSVVSTELAVQQIRGIFRRTETLIRSESVTSRQSEFSIFLTSPNKFL